VAGARGGGEEEVEMVDNSGLVHVEAPGAMPTRSISAATVSFFFPDLYRRARVTPL